MADEMEEIAMPPQGGRGCIAAGDVSRKYAPYKLKVDEDQDDKATELKLNCFARPHMRAFHCSWWSFFIAFFHLVCHSAAISGNKKDSRTD
mmetsp:Transcript_11195/g.16792  ORF Transcript_11195/g.16792 Transcript_11195/m.16792 type:complete len:91 (-) Transcript_11195:1548-1820(-)